MGSSLSRSFFVMLLVALFAGLCFGQTQTARLQGAVHDASGANVPGAKIVAVNTQTKVSSETTSNADGLYVLPALQPGAYTLTVEAGGFRKAIIEAIELDAASNVSQSIALEVGQMTETIEVQANTISVQSTDAQVANSVTIKDIE